MNDWLIDLVGLPYLTAGRKPDTGFDCFGMVRWVLAQRGFEMSENVIGWRKTGRRLGPDESIRRYDVLCFAARNNNGFVDHVGVAVNENNFIHAGSMFNGVVCDRLGRYSGQLKAIIRFEDK